MDAYQRTARTRVRRAPKRTAYDRETVHAVLDAGIVCHVGYVTGDQPYVTPTLYWRAGEHLYWHGSSASRMLRHLQRGVPACVTVTHIDGLVMARSGFHHSVNYRSVMALGIARLVAQQDKERVLETFMEQLAPGRWAELRPPTRHEIKATSILWMSLQEVSAKVRTGGPIDDEADYGHPVWAGVVPLRPAVGMPLADVRLLPGLDVPDYLNEWSRYGWTGRPALPEAAE
jgi:uncharacterized protein